MPVERLGPYLVRRSISSGKGNAEVFEAAHETTGDLVAIKSPRARSATSEPYLRFRDEVAFHGRYRDPGVLPMIDSHAPPVLSAGERAWLAMPIASPFDRALADADLPTIVGAIASVAETLARLSADGIHHRDIKPPNLFVRNDEYLLGDFGLVTFPNKPEVTGDNRHVGPIYYIAPEMVMDPKVAAGEPADVYSLAKTLWVLATGFPRPTPGPLNAPQLALRSLVSNERALLLESVLDFCTRFDPNERPPMAGVASELRDWLTTPQGSPRSADDQLAEATERIAALMAPGFRDEQARLDRIKSADVAHERLKGALAPVKAALDSAIPIYDSGGGFTDMFVRFPQLSASDTQYVVGWASIHRSPAHRIALFAWVGVQLRSNGMLRLAAAYALEPYAGTGRELLWSESRDVVPDGPSEAEAVVAIRRGLVEGIPRAVTTFADRLQGH